MLVKVDRAESRDTVNREKYTANLDTFLLRRNTRLASIKLIERISTPLDALLVIRATCDLESESKDLY